MRPEDVPIWAPPVVRDLVARWLKVYGPEYRQHPDHLKILRRLATNLGMKKVWKELNRRQARPAGVEDVENRSVRGEIVPGGTAHEKALALFFCRVYELACHPPTVITAKERDDLTARVFSAVSLCRWIGEKQAADRLEVIARRGGRHLLVAAKHHKDDTGRAYMRELGDLTRKLFGSVSSRTAATTATVALGRPVKSHQVRSANAIRRKKPARRSVTKTLTS
jgi:hypothetical protein